MERKKIMKLFLRDLRRKVPNQKKCQVATEEEIMGMARKIDFEPMEKFLSQNSLDLTLSEIPQELRFNSVCYFVLCTEVMMEESHQLLDDSEIWNFSDYETLHYITDILNEINTYQEYPYEEITEVYLSDFLDCVYNNNFLVLRKENYNY